MRRSTLYRHFPDEAALFDACTAHWNARQPAARTWRWAAIADPDERLRGRARRAVRATTARTEPMLENLLRDERPCELVRERFARLPRLPRRGARDADARPRPRGAARRRRRAAIGHALAFSPGARWSPSRGSPRRGGRADVALVARRGATGRAAPPARAPQPPVRRTPHTFPRMPPLITREEALRLGELEDHAEIEALVERAWQARIERFDDSTDMCSLVNAKSGGCAEDCGFCAQSRFAEAETPMHAMMEPEQILEHARAAEAAGAHRFCMVTQGQGLSKRDFEKYLRGRAAGRRAHQPQALRLDRPHVGRARPGAEGGRRPARAPQRGDRRELLRRGLDARSATRAGSARSEAVREAGLETCVGGILNLGETPRAARRDGLRAGGDRPDERPDQPAQPAPRNEVRRPRVHGPVGGREVDRDLPPDPARSAVPPVRRPRREPRRAPAAGRQGRASTA